MHVTTRIKTVSIKAASAAKGVKDKARGVKPERTGAKRLSSADSACDSWADDIEVGMTPTTQEALTGG